MVLQHQQKLKLALMVLCVVVWTWVGIANASAKERQKDSKPEVAIVAKAAPVKAKKSAGYLHVDYARSQAKVHAWQNPCNASTATCWQYPFATSYYYRYSNTKVRVEIGIGWYSCSRTKYAYRVLAVTGIDGDARITSDGSAPYWSC